MDISDRLKQAREAAGFETAVEAADAMGVPRSTYIGHENGSRGVPAKRVPQYARKFKVAEEWLLYGKGKQSSAPQGDIGELIEYAGALGMRELRILKNMAREMAIARDDDAKTG